MFSNLRIDGISGRSGISGSFLPSLGAPEGVKYPFIEAIALKKSIQDKTHRISSASQQYRLCQAPPVSNCSCSRDT